MKHDHPSLNDLLMVESLAYHKSLNEAARELLMSPSALSRQLSSLEVKMGVRIFERDTRNITLTPTGIEFIQLAGRVLYTTEYFLGCLKPHLKARLRQLTISALPSVTGVLLPRLLNGFKAIHPEINLVINDEHTAELIDSIERGEIDLAITVGTVSVRSKLSFMPLAKENLVVISGRQDLSITKNEYTLKEIVDLPMISSKKGTSYRDYVESVCERKNLRFTPRIEVAQLATAVAMVSEGLGIAILPALVLPIYCTENLKFHRVREFNLSNKIGIAYRSDKSLSPIANNFLLHAKMEFKSIYQSILDENPL